MRFSEFIKTPSFAVAVVFILAALVASKISSPWRDGPLLMLKPTLPETISHHVPLIQWPEPAQDTTDFQFDLGLDDAIDTSSSPSEDKEDGEVVTPPYAQDAKPPQARDAESPAPSDPEDAAAGVPSKTPDKQPTQPTLPHQRMLARLYNLSTIEDLSHVTPAAHRKPAAKRVDPKDRTLLESIKKLRSKLPSGGDFLHIPCTKRDAESASDSSACMQRALDNFYASLRDRAFGKDGHTRWMQYGDSLVIGDTLTGELRRLFQQQFGDGGHGWLYIGHPLRPVRAENIRVYPSDAWYIRTIVRHSENGGNLFGLGGAEFRPTDDSNLLVAGAREKGPGHTLERFHLYYFAPPGVESASFHVTVNGTTHTEHIEATPGASNVHTFEVPAGNHRVQLSGFSSTLRYYGLVSETSGPGVVIDNVGLVSSRHEHLLKLNEEQWHDQLAFRDPDVVAFLYGVNAASSNKSRAQARSKDYIRDYTEVIRRAMHDAPKRDCVVLSLLTRGTREGNKIYPTGAVEVLNKTQKEVAISSGCAFFDTTGVMGGADGTQAWVNHRPPLLGADLSHPTRLGYQKLARQLYVNLIDGFIDYMERRVTQGGDK